MESNVHRRNLKHAIIASAIINGSLILSAFTPESSLYTRIANAIARPPGVIIDGLFIHTQHTLPSFAAAALGSLLCSIVFYFVVAFAALEVFMFRSLLVGEETRYKPNKHG
jgi:hypothetical protein